MTISFEWGQEQVWAVVQVVLMLEPHSQTQWYQGVSDGK